MPGRAVYMRWWRTTDAGVAAHEQNKIKGRAKQAAMRELVSMYPDIFSDLYAKHLRKSQGDADEQ